MMGCADWAMALYTIKNDRKEVTYNAECGYTAFSQMADKYIIPQEHHAGNGCLADKGGRSQPDHVADVTAGKPHAFPAQLDTVNT